jgi:hypothetical protein
VAMVAEVTQSFARLGDRASHTGDDDSRARRWQHLQELELAPVRSAEGENVAASACRRTPTRPLERISRQLVRQPGPRRTIARSPKRS